MFIYITIKQSDKPVSRLTGSVSFLGVSNLPSSIPGIAYSSLQRTIIWIYFDFPNDKNIIPTYAF